MRASECNVRRREYNARRRVCNGESTLVLVPRVRTGYLKVWRLFENVLVRYEPNRTSPAYPPLDTTVCEKMPPSECPLMKTSVDGLMPLKPPDLTWLTASLILESIWPGLGQLSRKDGIATHSFRGDAS